MACSLCVKSYLTTSHVQRRLDCRTQEGAHKLQQPSQCVFPGHLANDGEGRRVAPDFDAHARRRIRPVDVEEVVVVQGIAVERDDFRSDLVLIAAAESSDVGRFAVQIVHADSSSVVSP